MKRLLLLTPFVLALSLALVHTQALAGSMPADAHKGGTPGPGRTPGPPATPGAPQGSIAQVTPGAQATAQAGLHGKPGHFRGTITSVSTASLTLALADGSSATLVLTPDTRIQVPGPKAQGDVLVIGMQAMVLAFGDSGSGWTARSVMAIPGQPVRVHRVGEVTAYAAGVSITITATDGQSYTFALTGDTKVLPPEQAGNLAVGSRVTIIAPRDPSTITWTATGIVVHPPGS